MIYTGVSMIGLFNFLNGVTTDNDYLTYSGAFTLVWFSGVTYFASRKHKREVNAQIEDAVAKALEEAYSGRQGLEDKVEHAPDPELKDMPDVWDDDYMEDVKQTS